MPRPSSKRETNDSLAVRAAWLHFIGGLTQAEVADRLNVSTVKAHRLIARATEIGAVKVSIEGKIAECADLEERLRDRYGLGYCEVIPEVVDGGEEGLINHLGAAAASFLERELASRAEGVIGIGNGRTLSALVGHLAHKPVEAVRFVSLLGGLTRNYAANPFDVMHRLAEKTQAEAYTMPVPFYANTVENRAVFLAQRGVQEVLAITERADLMIVGLGTVDARANIVTSRLVEPEEIQAVADDGAVGEMLGHFFAADGSSVQTDLTDRSLSPRLDSLSGRRIVGIAGGQSKVHAIAAVLASGLLKGLITDEGTAIQLAALPALYQGAPLAVPSTGAKGTGSLGEIAR